MAHPVADIFANAAELNRNSQRRTGNEIRFVGGERIIFTGDIHGNRPNLTKIIAHAKLSSDPKRMLVLQELIHGGPTDNAGGCRSFELLLRAARLKIQHPDQVHFLLANHDSAEITGNEISKDGCGSCKAFHIGLTNAYGEDVEEINLAIKNFLRSLALVGRCDNGVVMCHSLPSPGRERFFDKDILQRPYRDEDYARGQSIYELIWGRRQDEATVETMAELLGAAVFINGHQPQDNGYCHNGRQLIIASEHAHGMIAEFDADEPVDADLLDTLIRPIASL